MKWAVVLAGGEGTRFWPKSRRNHPKQFHRLFSERTLIEETVSRVSPFVPPHRIVIVTHERYRKLVQSLFPRIPKRHLLSEPEGKSTAPSLALASVVIKKEDPDATLIVLPSDHWIGEKGVFQRALKQACGVAQKGLPVTFGIRPTRAHTGYGYLHCVRRIKTGNGIHLHLGTRFLEKPSRAKAQRLCRSGSYLWNSGMFVFDLGSLGKLMSIHLRSVHQAFEKLGRLKRKGRFAETVRSVYRAVPSISIDYGLMEKLSRFYVVEAPFGWCDLGNWSETEHFLPQMIDGNRIHGEVLVLRSHGNIVQGDKRLIALLGVRDLIVVDTKDALLICAKDQAQEVRSLVHKLRARKLTKYL